MASNENLIKIFEYALNQEHTGKEFFRKLLQRMGIGAAVTAFQVPHQGRGEAYPSDHENPEGPQKRAGRWNCPTEKDLAITATNYFDKRSKSEFLEQCFEGSMVPEVTIFNTAWLIEKDLSEFYEKMAGQTTGKAKKALTFLSKWEKEHEKFFREYRDKFSEIYSQDGLGWLKVFGHIRHFSHFSSL